MKHIVQISVIALVALLLSSCANPIPFTKNIKNQYSLDDARLKKLQFYISSDVKLQRGERTEGTHKTDDDGKLIIESSASVDEVFIPAGTPGVVVKVIDGDKFAVSFDENGDDSRFLVFGDPNNRGRYYLMGAEWKAGKGKIIYGGSTYYVMPGGAGAYLKFEMKKIRKYQKNRSSVKGRRV